MVLPRLGRDALPIMAISLSIASSAILRLLFLLHHHHHPRRHNVLAISQSFLLQSPHALHILQAPPHHRQHLHQPCQSHGSSISNFPSPTTTTPPLPPTLQLLQRTIGSSSLVTPSHRAQSRDHGASRSPRKIGFESP
uniref:Uncharacterized protein n=1 Tax=Physcomitrium patens TaxID=3218 RepID=A0A2K1J563_PHYPA|nr:hypothetical protein PHYPA_022509 [Physcomitrium patens]